MARINASENSLNEDEDEGHHKKTTHQKFPKKAFTRKPMELYGLKPRRVPQTVEMTIRGNESRLHWTGGGGGADR